MEGTLKLKLVAKCSQFNSTANVTGSLVNDAISGLIAATNGVNVQASAGHGSYAMQMTGTKRGNSTNERVNVTATLTYMPKSGAAWERSVSIDIAPSDAATFGFEFSP